jgi:hypothetical protein
MIRASSLSNAVSGAAHFSAMTDAVFESAMTDGLSRKSQELRRHLLSHNGPDVVRRMQEAGFKDLVGLILEMTTTPASS